jgi:hypothetical protein
MRATRKSPRKERGALVVMLGIAIVVLFAFMGIALDLAQTYNLKTELQNAADAAALSGAKELNGSLTGINNAVAKAKATAAANNFRYSTPLTLVDANISFGSDPDTAAWKTVGEAQGAPSGLLFIRIDTGPHSINTYFMKVFPGGAAQTQTFGRAVAGRFSIEVTPIAVCALDTQKYRAMPHAGTADELTELGFRRGMAYDVISINPLNASENKFVLNPLDIPTGPGDSTNCTPSNNNVPTIRPFLCSGQAAIITTLPGYVYANPGMSSTLNAEINSRFEAGGSCTVPPDANVKEYTATGPPGQWMNPALGAANQGVELVDSTGKQHIPFYTIPPPIPSPAVTAAQARQWGVLWSYAAAVQYAASPPAGGYTAFPTATWPNLYPSALPLPANSQPCTNCDPTGTHPVTYPAPSPYMQGPGSIYFQAGGGARDRRVLNLAIVDCTQYVSAGKCKGTLPVLGVGRYFMPIKADIPHSLFGEFAGLVPDALLTAEIKLYH